MADAAPPALLERIFREEQGRVAATLIRQFGDIDVAEEAKVEGPAAGLAAVDELDLDAFHLFHATRADLLVRLGRPAEAATAYDRALELVANDAERRFLAERRAGLG